MIQRLLILASAASGCFLLLAQRPEPATIFTAAQAEVGRKVFETKGGTSGNKDAACAYCHTNALTGRSGAADELPLLTSLEPAMQEAIQNSGAIPPLAGTNFMNKWGTSTTKDLVERIKLAVGQYEPEETSVNLAAYILQVNGAKSGSQPLTAAASVEIRSAANDRR